MRTAIHRLLTSSLLALTLATLVISPLFAQPADTLFEATFDSGLTADKAAGDATAAGPGVQTRRVSVRTEGLALQLQPREHLSYAAEGNVNPRRGAIEFALQPLTRLDDGQNQRIVTVGKPDTPSSLHIWKSAMFDDLRFRIIAEDGAYEDVAFPGVKDWVPGHWHHVLCTWDLDRAFVRIHIDSKPAADWTGAARKLDKLEGRVWLGSGVNGADRALCALDDVRIYDKPLTGRRVQAVYERFLSQERSSSLGEWTGGIDRISTDLLPEPDFTFVTITDPHLSQPGALGRYQHNHRIEKLVEQINSLNPDFVLNLGDTVTTFPGHKEYEACAQMAKDVFSRLTMPMYYIAGNHDIGNKLQLTYHGPQNSVFMDRWFISDENIALYRKWFGKDYYSFDHKGCHFAVIDNNLLNSGMPEEQRQWEWLEADLEANKGARLKVLATHNILFWVSPDEPGTGNYENVNEPARSRILNLARKYDIRAILTGHTHHRISNVVGDTRLLTLPSACFARNFGDAYGLNNLEVVWDPERVGYYVCRVYGDELRSTLVRTYPPIPPTVELQAGNMNPVERMVSLKSGELDDSSPIGMVSAPPPQTEQGIWSAAHVIDGVTPANLGERRVETHAWTSDPHDPGEEKDFLQVQLAQAVAVSRVELHPRIGPFGFPSKFDILVSTDGDGWATAASREDMQPKSDDPVVVELDGAPTARFVRLDIHAVAPNSTNIGRAAMMEFSVLDADGVNHALAALGATVTCGTQAGGGKVTLDDNAWEEVSQAGVKWAFVPANALSWGLIESTPGQLAIPPHIRRAFTMGRPRGVNYVAPITCENPAYESADAGDMTAAFARYVRFLADELGSDAAGFYLWPQGALEDAARYKALVRTFSDAVKSSNPDLKAFLMGPSELPERAALAGLDGVIVGADLGEPRTRQLTPERTMEALRDPEPVCSAWIALSPWTDGINSETQWARALGRLTVACLAEGFPVLYEGRAGAGGLLNARATPSAPLYAMKSLTTLLGAAEPTDLGSVATMVPSRPQIRRACFSTTTGPVIALWQNVARSSGQADELPVSCSMVLKQRPTRALLVDGQRSTIQRANVEPRGDEWVIAGLQVRDYPLFIKLMQK